MKFGTCSLNIIAIFSFLLISSACSKKQSTPKVSLQFQSKNVASSQTHEIDFVIVNVTDSAGALKVFEYECEYTGCPSIDFEVDKPGNSLIQLLVITEGSDQVTKLNYGDVFKDLKGGDNYFELQLSEIGSFSAEAQVAGRYIPSASHALAGKSLTGDIVMQAYVAPDRPTMKIKKFEIFGGWFRLFVLDSVGFIYKFTGYDQNGNFYSSKPIFNDLHSSDGLKLDSSGLSAQGSERVHYKLSGTIYDRHDHNDPYQSRSFNGKIVGFFGSNPDSATLCADTFNSSTIFDGQNGNSHLCSAVSADNLNCVNYYSWNDILNQSTNIPATLDGSTNSCVGSTNEFEVDLEAMGDGDDGLMDFYGPFVNDNASFFSDVIEVDEQTQELKWYIASQVYLPGGIEVFINPNIQGFDRHDIETDRDSYDCEKLSQYGFQSQGVVNVVAGEINRFTIPNTVWSSSTGLALCPVRPSGGYYNSAIITDDNHSGYSQPDRIDFAILPQFDGGTATMNNGACVPLQVELRDQDNNVSYSSNHYTIALGDGGDSNNKYYHSLSDCEADTSAISQVDVNDRSVVFFNSGGTPATSYTLRAQDTGSVLTESEFSFTAQAAAAMNSIDLVPDFYRDSSVLEAATTEGCAPFVVVAKDANGEVTKFDGIENFDLSSSSAFHSDSSCSSLIGGAITPAGTKSLYPVTLVVPGSAQNYNSSMTCSASLCPSSPIINIVSPGAFNHIHMDDMTGGPHSASAGGCIELKIGAYDSSHPMSFPTNFPATSNIDLNNDVASGTFWSDAACTTTSLTAAPSVGVSGGQTSKTIYFKWNSGETAGTYHIQYDYDQTGESKVFTLDLL